MAKRSGKRKKKKKKKGGGSSARTFKGERKGRRGERVQRGQHERVFLWVVE